MKKKIVIAILLILPILLLGCKHYNMPKGFPKVDKMADILVEIQITEALITQEFNYSKSRHDEVPEYYKFILEKYGYSAEQFDTIRKWYAHNPELYIEVHKKMLNRLSKKEAQIKAKIEEEKRIEKKEQEEKEKLRQLSNLWKDSTSIIISPNDTIDKFLYFEIDVDTLNLEGAIELSAKYKFLKQDMSAKPKIELIATYLDSICDTIAKTLQYTFNEQINRIKLDLRDSIYPKTIKGSLLKQDSTEQVNVQIDDIYLENIIDSLKVKPKELMLKGEEILEITKTK